MVYEYESEFLEEENESVWDVFYGYRTSVGIALSRLALMGFSQAACQESFNLDLRASLSETRNRITEIDDEDDWEIPRLKSRLMLLEKLDFQAWCGLLRWLLDNYSFEATDYLEFDELKDRHPLVELYFYDNADDFPAVVDVRLKWVAVLSTFDSSAYVEMDISEFVSTGRIHPEDRVVECGWEDLRSDVAENEPVLVLTEGSSDATILRLSLAALYPEVEERFQFLDFGAVNLAGGASSVVAQVRAFVAAGIRNKILAIFDNDAAAREATRTLEKVRLPKNVGIMRLPEIAWAKSYPTLGPLGKQMGNVNGMAVSVEFFAGQNLLKLIGEGELEPIVWGSYNSTMKTYHGEIGKKSLIAEAMCKSLTQERSRQDHQANHPELCLLWQEIFKMAETLR